MAYPKRQPCKNGHYSVYVHYVPATNKRYVGVTGQEPQRRFQHGFGYEKNEEFYADIKKYGWKTIETEIIATTEDFELATCFENAAIERYDTLNPEHGYNNWTSGSKAKPNPKVGRNISKAKMGHPVSQETRQKLRDKNARGVVQLSLDGKYIRTFPSMAVAADAVGGSKSNISAVCRGKKPTCRGYKWMTLDRFNDAKAAEERERVKHGI